MPRLPVALFSTLFLLAATLTPAEAADPQDLPRLAVTLEQTSVSGLSSGAYMAGQFQLAHARIVKGAAIIAGGPYGCAESRASGWAFGFNQTAMNLTKAVSVCMLGQMRIWGYPRASVLAEKAKARAKAGEIGPLAAIHSDKIYIFSGKADRLVAPSVVAATADFYEALGVPTANIRFVKQVVAGHGFVTLGASEACDWNGKPFLVNCDYDQAGALLRHIYGPLQPPSRARRGQYVTFGQRPFMPRGRTTGMADTGLIYIPQDCRRGGCRVHIAFHGCDQTIASVGKKFVEGTGLTLWADTNRLVVLFPQVVRSFGNPQGCWDWWGYTGSDFLTRKAPQIQTVRAMLTQLAAKP